jgi:hypothetical protein
MGCINRIWRKKLFLHGRWQSEVEWIWWQFSFSAAPTSKERRERMKFRLRVDFQPLIHLGEVIGFEECASNLLTDPTAKLTALEA